MKKTLVALMLGLVSITGLAQYAKLEYTFDGQVNITPYQANLDEVLFSSYNTATGIVKIYDEDYSLLVSFTPKLPNGHKLGSTYYPSRKLYSSNNDLYVIIFSASTENGQTSYHYGLYNSNGDEVFDFGTASYMSFSTLFVVNNEYKIIFYLSNYGTGGMEYTSKCYKLGGISTALSSPTQAPQSIPYPNPATTSINLPYSISAPSSMLIYDVAGNLIDRKHITQNQNQLVLNVSSYPKGMYFYEVNGESMPFIVE
jgi:hypothetical protein